MAQYMIRIGRRKLVVPLTATWPPPASGRARALRIYEEARPGYHPLAQEAIDALLKTSVSK